MLEVSWWFLYFRFSRPGWGSYLGIPVNEPCPFQQLPRGLGSCPEASTSIRRPRRATWGAVRHFLRVDPESLERKDEDSLQPRSWSWKLRWRWVIRWSSAFHKLGIFLVKSGLVRVAIGRLGSWPRGTTKLLWRHLRVQGRLSFCYPRFVYSCIWTRFRTVDSQSCAVTLLRCVSFFCQMVFDG